MPAFHYVAVTRQGKRIKGKVEANDPQEAIGSLKAQGLYVQKIKPIGESIWTKEIAVGGNRVKSEHFVVFCRQFATLIRSGIGVVDAVEVLRRQTESKALQKALQEVLAEIRSGSALSSACERHGKIFPPLFVHMIRAGEVSGNLDETLEKLALFFEKEHGTKEKIKSALVYPVTVLTFAFLVTAFLVWKVVPPFIDTFRELGMELPLVTRMVIGFSDRFREYWFLYLGLPLFAYAGGKLYAGTERGRYQIDRIKLKFPVFGRLLQKSAIARFSRTFATLYAAGVPMLQTLRIVAQVVNNEVIRRCLLACGEQVRAGNSLTEPLKEHWAFPPMVVHMIGVGEKSGSLDVLLAKVADYYEAEVDAAAERLKSLLEPLLIALVAAVVGLIVFAVLLPSFTIYKNM
ncbi:type II secretion system F family protein [Bacillaceae bacterium]